MTIEKLIECWTTQMNMARKAADQHQQKGQLTQFKKQQGAWMTYRDCIRQLKEITQ